jgi:hypothetical protein
MRHDKDLNAGLADRGGDGSRIIAQPAFVGEPSTNGQSLPPSDRKSL